MTTILVHDGGVTREAAEIDPRWLGAGASEQVWVNLAQPAAAEQRLLAEVFGFHELAVEDALAEAHHPKIEAYDGVLYLILHGIAAGARQEGFVTHDVDFFLGPNYLVTVHQARSRSVEEEWAVCLRRPDLLGEGPASLLHRIVDRLVDHYRPEVDVLEDRLEKLERVVFERPRVNPLRSLLRLKTDIATLRRVVLPQRDAIARLARREFPQIPEPLAYRFRDVHDSLVRLTDESVMFQDRVTGLLDASLSNQSHRLAQVMKVLTVIATIFMPLTMVTGLYGMNVPLPEMPGGSGAQFWWILGLMAGLSGAMLWLFRRLGWL